MRRNILVTGFTGRLGSLVAGFLHEKHGLQPRVLIRQTHLDAADWQPPVDVEVAVGDLEHPNTLDQALAGIDAVFLVSPVHPQMQERELALAACAARQEKPPHIVKISGLGTQLDSFVDSGRWHAQIEHDIARLGLSATFLRPPFFMQNLGFQIDGMRQSGILRAAVEDAEIAMVDARDIAEVAAAVLLGGSPVEGQAVAVTGARSYSYAQVAEVASAVFGREVTYVKQTLDETRQALLKMGQPQWHIDILLQFNQAFMRGWGSAVSDTVAQVLDREPRSLANYFAGLVQDEPSTGTNPFPS